MARATESPPMPGPEAAMRPTPVSPPSLPRCRHAATPPVRTKRIQRQHRLDLHKGAVEAERFEHDLHHALAVGLGVERRVSQQDAALARLNGQLLAERVLHKQHATQAAWRARGTHACVRVSE